MNEDFFEAICVAAIDAPFEKILSGQMKIKDLSIEEINKIHAIFAVKN